MSGKKKKSPEVNLLELVPSRLVDYESGEDGLITILAPRFHSRIMKKLVESRLKRKFMKVQLDEIGSSVWKLCDGDRNIGEIGEEMRKGFGDKIEPCFDRLAVFFNQLENSRFIRYSNLDAVREKSDAATADGSLQ